MASKVTVHPDALNEAENSYYNDGGSACGSRATAYVALLQWYIDHPQIDGDVTYCRVSNLDHQITSTISVPEFLTLALSGKPEVPQELRDAFGNWETMDSVERDELVKAYNLGKGAK